MKKLFTMTVLALSFSVLAAQSGLEIYKSDAKSTFPEFVQEYVNELYSTGENSLCNPIAEYHVMDEKTYEKDGNTYFAGTLWVFGEKDQHTFSGTFDGRKYRTRRFEVVKTANNDLTFISYGCESISRYEFERL
jgi:hypothetical protein